MMQKNIFSILLLSLVTLVAHAAEAEQASNSLKQQADSIYQCENYAAAAVLYDSLLTVEGSSPEAYYNLGNCHYKMSHLAPAILAYERALRLAPGDNDIRFNLELARSKTIDRIAPASDMFLVAWWKGFTNWLSSDVWAVLAVVFFAICLICLFFRNFAPAFRVGSVVTLVLCILFVMASWRKAGELTDSGEAIVMHSGCVVRSAPSTAGQELFVLNEGTKVKILDSLTTGWHEVQLSDGKQGWLPDSEIEAICNFVTLPADVRLAD